MANDPHLIIATPKDRWCLALFLLRKGLTFNTRTAQKTLRRAKTSLELHAPTAGFMAEKQGTMELASDETPSVFEVAPETADLFTRLLESVTEPPMMAHEMAGLEPVLEQLEDRTHAAAVVAAHPEAKPLDPKTESWVRTTAPILENPARFVDVMGELLRLCRPIGTAEPGFAAFVAAFLEEAEVKPGRQRGGRLRPEAEQAPS